MWKEILAGVAAALAYYILRYDKTMAFNFWEYLRYEWIAFFKGIVGFFVLWGCWAGLNHFDFVPFKLPEMNLAMAVLIGFASKKIMDYVLRRLKQLNNK